jgi:hypothetical protein
MVRRTSFACTRSPRAVATLVESENAMSLIWMQSLMGILFVTVWLLIGQIIVGQRRHQQRPESYGAKNV